jgi:phosphatidylinositol alpha-mannosyltransferase
MKIGLLLDDTLDKPDGVQQAVVAIGQELTHRGHEVHYLVAETERTDIQNIHSIARYWTFRFNGNTVRTPLPVRKRNIKRVLAEIHFDALHVQMPYSPFFTARVLKYADKKIVKVGTFHILPYNAFAILGNKMLGLMLARNTRLLHTVFAVSEPARQFMRSSYRLSGEVLANPVNYAFYSSFQRQKMQKLQLVFVGRFDERKGVIQLVKAYSALPPAVRAQTELVMCGKGPLLDQVKQLAIDNGVSITFPGFVSDEEKAHYLANADIAVFPSTGGESFGIVLTEAMSAGSGVTIGGNNPGYASVLAQWPDTLFDPNDIKVFATLLEKFITQAAFRKTIGKNQQAEVKKYDIKRIVDRLEATYASR